MNLYYNFIYGGVKEVNEQSMTLTLNLWININWKDERLVPQENSSESKHLKWGKNQILKHIWKPTLQIKNLIDFQRIDVDTKAEEIYLQNQKGIVWVTMTYHAAIKTGCNMNFEKFPFDEQFCDFLVGTDSGTAEVLKTQGGIHKPRGQGQKIIKNDHK